MIDTLDKFYAEHPIIFGCIFAILAIALLAVAGRLEYIDDGYATCEHCQQTVYKAELIEYNGELVCDTCYIELTH